MTMMRRAFVVFVISGLAVAGAARLCAHDEFRFVGSIVTVAANRQRFGLRFKEEDGKVETVQIAITAKTEVRRDKDAVPISALKAGLYVVVDALGDDYDNLEAVTVRIVPPPAK